MGELALQWGGSQGHGQTDRLTCSPLGCGVPVEDDGVGQGMGGSGHRPGTRLPEAAAVLFTWKGPVLRF